MKFYKNENLTEELITLDLGIVEAGESKQFTFYVFNDSLAHLTDLEFEILHQEVIVISAPKDLLPQANSEFIIEWNPSVTLKEGLQARVSIKGKELWG